KIKWRALKVKPTYNLNSLRGKEHTEASWLREANIDYIFTLMYKLKEISSMHTLKKSQLISSEGEKDPKQAEILAALQAMVTDMYSIQGLQNAGINIYVLYPRDEDIPILDCPNIKVQGRTAHMSTAPFFERQIGPKVVDIHITGLPMNIDDTELREKNLPTTQCIALVG
ncbi:hypothetical protein ACJMK2_025783, partial [Sinanodonta woodiana]